MSVFRFHFLVLVIFYLCVINLVSSLSCIVNVLFIFILLLLVNGGDVYVVVVVAAAAAAAAAASGYVVVLAVLTR